MREHDEKRGVTDRLTALRENPVAISEEYRPVIGIPLPIHQGEQGPFFRVDAVGAWSIERGQGSILFLPFWLLPPDQHVFQSLWPLVRLLDGLLLPAAVQSADWYALWKEKQVRQSSETDVNPDAWIISQEIALAQLATYIGMPILAIGEGAEKLNVALGGSVSIPVKKRKGGESMTPDSWPRHVLHIRSQSHLAAWLTDMGQGNCEENIDLPWILPFTPRPRHGVERLARGLHVCAQDDDSHIVAFERRDGPFGFGVLGRIDWCMDQWRCVHLVQIFLQSCREFAGVRLQNDAWESLQEDICAKLYGRTQTSVVLTSPSSLTAESTQSSDQRGRQGSGTGTMKRLQRQPTIEEMRQIRRARLKSRA